MRIRSPLPHKETRLEIIPLIDIMFFLLASFMLVSLSMVNLRSVKVDLPSASSASPDNTKDLADISVDKSGSLYLDKKPIGGNELVRAMAAKYQANPKLRVMIDGDREARHGDIIRALDLVRSAGIDKVAFDIRPQSEGTTP